MGRPGLTTLILCCVGFMDLIVEPHVGHCHPVLRQSPRFVGADGGRGPQGLHGFQVLHQAVFPRHALGGEGQTHLKTRGTRVHSQPGWNSR